MRAGHMNTGSAMERWTITPADCCTIVKPEKETLLMRGFFLTQASIARHALACIGDANDRRSKAV